MGYEGTLSDASGNALTGYYNMRFSIVSVDSVASSVVWGPETHRSVKVVKGAFSVTLGSSTPIPPSLFSSSALYLKIEVANPGSSSNYELLSPSSPIVSVGNAFKAAEADTVSDGAITAAKLAADISISTTGKVTAEAFYGSGVGLTGITATIGDFSITQAKIATSAVTSEKLSDEAVTSEKISSSFLLPATKGGTGQNAYAKGDLLFASDINTLSKLPSDADGKVLRLSAGVPQWSTVGGTGTVILVDSGPGLTGGPITVMGTLEVKYDDLTIGLNSVSGSLEVKDLGISAAKIAVGAITGDRLATDIGISTTGKITAEAFYGSGANLTGITTEIADYSITASKLATMAVTSEKIATSAVTSEKLAEGAVTAEKLGSGSVTAEAIAVGAITGDRLATDISISTTGKITAEAFYGSGAGLTGIEPTPGGTSGAVQFNLSGALSGEASGLFYDTASKRFGIGTTSPGALLEVKGSGSGRFMAGQYTLDSAYSVVYMQGADDLANNYNFLASSTDNNFYINRKNSGNIYFLEGSATPHMTLKTGGNVGIGTMDPLSMLELQTSSPSGKGLIVKAAAGQTADLTQWQNSSGTAVASVDASGNFRFGGGASAEASTGKVWATEFYGSGANLTGITTGIADYSVTTTKLATMAVTAEKIATSAVTAEKLGSGAVTAEAIAVGAVAGDKLATDISISTTGKITAEAFYGSGANLTDITAEIADFSVTTTKLATMAVTSEKIATSAVTAEKLGSGAVTAEAIAVGAITGDRLATDINISTTGKITAEAFYGSGANLTGITTEIADYSVTTTKLATMAVTAEKLEPGRFSAITGVGTLDSLSVSGSAEISGAVVYTPSASVYSISAGEGVTTAMLAGKLIRIQGSGGAVEVSADPPVSAGRDGQVIILKGTSEINTVKFNSGAKLKLSGAREFTLGENDTLMLCYDSGDALWFELNRNDN